MVKIRLTCLPTRFNETKHSLPHCKLNKVKKYTFFISPMLVDVTLEAKCVSKNVNKMSEEPN